MPKTKIQKRLEIREKLLEEYKKLKHTGPFCYRAAMLLSQIRNLNSKLNISDYSIYHDKE